MDRELLRADQTRLAAPPAIDDIAVLRTELEHLREHSNSVRLPEGIGCVTPDDEHDGRGPTIRAARKLGHADARPRRVAYHRQQHGEQLPETIR